MPSKPGLSTYVELSLYFRIINEGVTNTVGGFELVRSIVSCFSKNKKDRHHRCLSYTSRNVVLGGSCLNFIGHQTRITEHHEGRPADSEVLFSLPRIRGGSHPFVDHNLGCNNLGVRERYLNRGAAVRRR